MPDNGKPAISVLMPVYNAERYVAEAVESILAQTFTDFEFLIIDDGSTDGSLAILQKYAAQDSRIRLKSRPNTGLVVALNEMLADARGEFIARMDADDISLPERFRLQHSSFEQDKSLLLAGTLVDVIDQDGDTITTPAIPLSHNELVESLLNAKGQMLFHPSVMMKKEALVANGAYEPQCFPVEDLHLFLKLSEVGTICNLNFIGIKYREHSAKVGHRFRAAQAAMAYKVINAARSSRGMNGLPFLPLDAAATSGWRRHAVWAWWALGSGNIKTARKHAWQAFIRRPWNPDACRLLLCAARGR